METNFLCGRICLNGEGFESTEEVSSIFLQTFKILKVEISLKNSKNSVEKLSVLNFLSRMSFSYYLKLVYRFLGFPRLFSTPQTLLEWRYLLPLPSFICNLRMTPVFSTFQSYLSQLKGFPFQPIRKTNLKNEKFRSLPFDFAPKKTTK